MPYGTPAQLANLGKPWTKETAPRQMGRPKGFTPLSSYITSLSVTGTDELLKIMHDRSQPPMRMAAARQLLIAAGVVEGHRPSDILASTDLVADRTEGKPVQQQRVEHTVTDDRPTVLDSAKWQASITKHIVSDNAVELPAPASGDDAQGDDDKQT